ncbi:MAG: hypothetical protein IPF75_08335 [Bacteroidetes bacterium]|nr:hypothetical protein [Bacteroidota bacterium]
MKNQNLTNYKKLYGPHHFFFLPLTAIMMIIGVVNYFTDDANSLTWKLFSIVSFALLYLAIMLRQHYALGNQDRIVRLEFRLRYFELFNKRSKQIEEVLSFSQIAALRYADDYQFGNLIERAVKEKLSSKEILKSIQNWQVDTMRL